MKETTEPHPDAKMEGDATTLMAASYGGDDAMISDLIQRGADLETKDAALIYACNGGRMRSVARCGQALAPFHLPQPSSQRVRRLWRLNKKAARRLLAQLSLSRETAGLDELKQKLDLRG
jgi:hypothetical protein